MTRNPQQESWLSRLKSIFIYVPLVMLFELLPLYPVTLSAWAALLWIALLLSTAAWIHIEVIGVPEDDAPKLTQWAHGLPWMVVLLLLFFGQDFWWSDFMDVNFRSLW